MRFLWNELRLAVPMIWHGNPFLVAIVRFTVEIAAAATGLALVLGLPCGLVLGLGRFRGRRIALTLANAGLALPPALVGAVLFLLSVRSGPLVGLDLFWTRTGVLVAQTILAVPYVIALSAAAIQTAAPGVVAQARLLGAGRRQLAVLALRESRRGVLAAALAALGVCFSEVAAVAIIGGNIYGYDQTLASATLYAVQGARYADALAVAIVLGGLILVVMGSLAYLQAGRGRRASSGAAATPGWR